MGAALDHPGYHSSSRPAPRAPGAAPMDQSANEIAFPRLTADEMNMVRPLASREPFADGQVVFRAGDADIDFFIVESGELEILNPTNDNSRIVVHVANEFAGDIDMLTRRPVIVTAVARGDNTVLLRVPGKEMRRLLNTVPRLGDKLLVAFRTRREILTQAGILGMKVIGEAHSPETMLVREFLH